MGPLTGGRRRRDLLRGLAVVLPIVLVALIGYWAASAAVGVAGSIVRVGASLGLEGPLAAGGLLLTVAIVVPLLLVGVGVGVRHRYGHRVVSAVDRTLATLPAVGPIYSGLRRSRDAVAGGGEAFSEVVRVELAEGVHAMAFLVDRPEAIDSGVDGASGTADARTGDRVADALSGPAGDDLVTVFLPFAPNPAVGGHLLGVHEDRLRDTGLSVPEGIGMLVGFGSQSGGPESDPPLGTFYAQFGAESRDGDGSGGEESADDDPTAG